MKWTRLLAIPAVAGIALPEVATTALGTVVMAGLIYDEIKADNPPRKRKKRKGKK